MKFRKKPVVIEAIQLLWENWGDICEFVGVGKAEEGFPSGCYVGEDGCQTTDCSGYLGLTIPTLEGVMVARERDWIIRGVAGEFYPCKPDIFEATYEPVVERVVSDLKPMPYHIDEEVQNEMDRDRE